MNIKKLHEIAENHGYKLICKNRYNNPMYKKEDGGGKVVTIDIAELESRERLDSEHGNVLREWLSRQFV